MKKIILTALLLAAFSTSASAVVFSTYNGGGLSWAASNNVTISGSSANATGTIGYWFESKHGSGSRTFATTSKESKIFWKDGTAFVGSGSIGASADVAALPAGYTNSL